jgi:hypothetical protein
MGVIPSFWRLMWPLLLITWGLLLLAERAAVEVEGYPPYTGSPWQCGGQGAGQSVYPGTTPGAAPQSAGQSTGQGAGQSEPPTGALVAPSLENDKMGGQS